MNAGGTAAVPFANRAISADVLVVEDEADLLRSTLSVLRMSGFSVAEAEDGEVARGLLNEHRYGMVLLDLRMPRLDGVSLAETLEDVPPIVVASAHSLSADERRRLGAKVVSYLRSRSRRNTSFRRCAGFSPRRPRRDPSTSGLIGAGGERTPRGPVRATTPCPSPPATGRAARSQLGADVAFHGIGQLGVHGVARQWPEPPDDLRQAGDLSSRDGIAHRRETWMATSSTNPAATRSMCSRSCSPRVSTACRGTPAATSSAPARSTRGRRTKKASPCGSSRPISSARSIPSASGAPPNTSASSCTVMTVATSSDHGAASAASRPRRSPTFWPVSQASSSSPMLARV